MMKSESLVSVIIPVYNCERYLSEAIESVLLQDYEPLELIVVDDGSTDGSAKVARNFETAVRYHYQTNAGQAAARNTGIELARGSFYAFLDADDVWTKGRLRRQMEAFTANPSPDVVTGLVKQFYSPELDESYKSRIRCPRELVPGYLGSAMVLKQETFDRVGAFETVWRVGVDMSWFLRLQESGLSIKVLDEVVLRRRLHENNKGITQRDFISQRARIIKAALDRRRKQKLGTEPDEPDP